MKVKKDLAQAEQEVLQARIKAERAILKDIEEQYKGAITEINLHLAQLLGRQDANLPHVIHQVEYQRMLKQQVQASLDKLHSTEYESVTEYLNESYTDAFVGTMYTLHHQDMPVILPINQALAVKAITLDTKLKKTMYEEMGKDISKLKRTIQQEITRGISSGMMYSEIARNISNQAGIPMRRAKTIARTEGGRVQEQASYDAALQAKEKGANLVKQWNAIRDGKTRDAHRALHNQTRELDEPFEIDGEEAMHPHDFGVAALDCNCRCTMLTLAKASLDADTLKQMQEDAHTHGLMVKDSKELGHAQAKNIAEFKKRYLKAAEAVEKPASNAAAVPSIGNNKEGIHSVGNINRSFFKAIAEDVTTDEVIITDERITHSNRHLDAYKKYGKYIPSVLADPDFAFRGNKPNTAMLIKRIEQEGKTFELVLRLHVSSDNPEYKNSVLSFWDISEARRKNYERNKDIIYKKE